MLKLIGWGVVLYVGVVTGIIQATLNAIGFGFIWMGVML
jgi:hypothetical protein